MRILARTDRLKEAKSEAEQIIAAYRSELEANYKIALDKARYNLSYYCFVMITITIFVNIAIRK